VRQASLLDFMNRKSEEARVCSYHYHPQPTSLSLAVKAAKIAGLGGQVVLDPFCGTGACLYAALRAGARKAIGTDIEDWSAYLRPEVRDLLTHRSLVGEAPVELYWGVDALDAIRSIEHDVLFTDPPNPWDLTGGVCFSAIRETGMGFSDLRRYWRDRLSPRNLMGKGTRAVKYLLNLLAVELRQGKRIMINLFETSRKSLIRAVASLFVIKPLGVGYWHEILEVRA